MRIKKILPYLVIALLLIPTMAAGQTTTTTTTTGPERGGWTLDDILDILDEVANWLYVIGFAVALIVVVIGGIGYMTAGGNEDRQKSAKKTIITGLVGAGIILLAGIILDTLTNLLGLSTPV